LEGAGLQRRTIGGSGECGRGHQDEGRSHADW
jgi:hypothetical protein